MAHILYCGSSSTVLAAPIYTLLLRLTSSSPSFLLTDGAFLVLEVYLPVLSTICLVLSTRPILRAAITFAFEGTMMFL